MQKNPQQDSSGGLILLLVVIINAIVLEGGASTHPEWYALLPFSLLVLFTVVIVFKSKLFP